MLGSSQTCSICTSEEVIRGCVCDNEIILLGVKCLSDHFIETSKDHNPVELDLALRMKADPSLEIFNQFYTETQEISKDTNEKIKTISKYKASLSEQGKALIKSYKELGIEKVVENRIESKTSSIDEIVSYIFDNINLKQLISQSASITAQEIIQQEEHKSTLKIERSQASQVEILQTTTKKKDAEYKNVISAIFSQDEGLKVRQR